MATTRVKTDTLSATGSVVLGLGGSGLAFVGISGTYTTVSGIVEGTADGTNWFAVPTLKVDSLQNVNGSFSPVNSSTNGWWVLTSRLSQIRYRLTAIASGSVAVQLCEGEAKLPLEEATRYMQDIVNTAKVATAVAAGAGAADVVVVASGPGVLNKVVCSTTGSAALKIYDHASASSGAKLLWTSSTTLAQGTVTELNIPFYNGLVALQASGSAAVTVGYSLL